MEAKLREYRALRRRKELIDNAKETLEKSKEKLLNFLVPNVFSDMANEKSDEVLLVSNQKKRKSNFQASTFIYYVNLGAP